MIKFNDLLNQTANGWKWTIPENFNIAYACVRQHVEQGKGSNIALIIEDDKQGTTELSYSQLDTLSGRFVYTLKELGLSSDDRVLIRLPNSVDYPVSFFGCLKQGAIAVPTSTLLSAPEVAYLAKDSGAKVLVTAKSMWPELKSILSEDTQLTAVLLSGAGEMPELDESLNVKVLDLDALLNDSPNDDSIVNCSVNAPAYLVYTSGTTG
ncbi:MAG: AMP-binding protein, partial [Thalassotalea sp.]|nr:AMP-binding protein [Thalassotalea sp.]